MSLCQPPFIKALQPGAAGAQSPSPPHANLLQAVYKTYIDVVHIQKDEASNLFTVFSEDTQSQEVELSQGNPADAPETQARPMFL